MTAARAAEICDIPEEKIVEAARMYAQAKPASISWGLAIDQKANGMQAGQCILDLMAIGGNIDVPGGNVLGDVTSGLNEVGFGFEKGVGDLVSEMIGLAEYPAYCNLIMNAHGRSHAPDAGDRRALPHQIGHVLRQQPDVVHVGRTQALA